MSISVPSWVRLGLVALNVATWLPAQAGVAYHIEASCSGHAIFGAITQPLACPSRVTGRAVLPEAYVPGTRMDFFSGLGSAMVSWDAPISWGVIIAASPFSYIQMPETSGAPLWDWSNPVGFNYANGAGRVEIQSE